MSPMIPILSALLLTLMSGSTEGEQRMDPIPLLRETLEYWYKTYKTYKEEVNLGYCWANYLLKITFPLPANKSVSCSITTRDCSDTIIEATKSQRNLFPQNVMDNEVTPKETRKAKHLRKKRSNAKSTISKVISDLDEQIPSKWKIQERRRWTIRKIEETSRAKGKVDKNEKIMSMLDYHVKTRWRFLSIVPELLRKALRDGREFSSRETSSRAVNPMPNPRDDDKVDFGLTYLWEKDLRRKILRSLTSHRDSFVEDAFASRSFSLKLTRGGSLDSRRFPSQRYSSSQKRKLRTSEVLSDPWMSREDHGIEQDPEHRSLLNNDESSSMPQSRRVNTSAEYARTLVVKLMDSEENSSCNSTINSKTPCRKPELFREVFLSPRDESAKRPVLESRGSREEAFKRNALLRFKMVGGSDTKKRHSRQPREEKSSRDRRDVSTAMIHPFFSSEFRRSHQETLHESHGFPPAPTILRKSKRDDDLIRTARNASSLSNVGQFIGNDSTIESAQHSKLIALQTSREPIQSSLAQPVSVKSIPSFIITSFKTLEMFFQVGRRAIEALKANMAFVCTKDYLLAKFVKWMEDK